MSLNLNAVAICIIASVIVLNVSPCTCSKTNTCFGAAGVTPGITFKLTDSTGRDILTFAGSVTPVPDSIKLKEARTGYSFPLFISQGTNGTLIYSQQYTRPANVTDSLIFTFGNARPDTLIVTTALVDTWRGDECPRVQSPGIKRVMLRNQVLLETTDDQAVFTIKK